MANKSMPYTIEARKLAAAGKCCDGADEGSDSNRLELHFWG
jgi:hypothetical protein